MREFFEGFLKESGIFSFLISILINILINLFPFIPSYFLTAINIAVFGFWLGTLLSFIGESIGAIVSFIIYRKGLHIFEHKLSPKKQKFIVTLQGSSNLKAFYLILLFRIIPFMPSGVVTLGAAFSNVTLFVFGLASTIGKFPALLLETFAVNQVIQWLDIKIVIVLILLMIFGTIIRYYNRKNNNSDLL
jgi:uncharacterized membrane protein YdjX (TVP38/TMEM64 family)